MIKICCRCKTEKGESDFGKRSDRPSGLQYYCKKCGSILRKQYRKGNEEKYASYDHRDKEEIYLKNKSYYWRHRESEKVRAASWYWDNLERASRNAKKWDERNPGRRSMDSKLWKQNNPGRIRILNFNRKASKLEALGISSDSQILNRIEVFGSRCWVCGNDWVSGRNRNAIDHVKPLNSGGSNWPANLRPICKSCNSRKNKKWPIATKPNFNFLRK
jgi:5-methylcytosine-specific restriction endonuclease McrA